MIVPTSSGSTGPAHGVSPAATSPLSPKSKDSAYVAPPLPPPLWLGHRRRLCTGCIPFPRLFVRGSSLGLVESIRKLYWGGRWWRRRRLWSPLYPSSASPPRSVRSSCDGGERSCCCLFESGSGVAPHDGDTFQLSLSPSSLALSARWSFLLLFAPFLFANRAVVRAAPIALRQRARVKVLA